MIVNTTSSYVIFNAVPVAEHNCLYAQVGNVIKVTEVSSVFKVTAIAAPCHVYYGGFFLKPDNA